MGLNLSKTVTLRSSDGKDFKVKKAVALQSLTLKRMIEDDDCGDGDVIHLPKVTSKILAKVIEYCKKHVETIIPIGEDGKIIGDDGRKNEILLLMWDGDFINVDRATLFELILAANYLNIDGLLDLSLGAVGHTFSGKRVKDIRKKFNSLKIAGFLLNCFVGFAVIILMI
ncbi:hypothetical protein MKW98_030208, partial [Papaver atlanticum]